MTPDPTPVPPAHTPRTPAQKAAIHGRNAIEQYPDEDRTPALTEPTAMAYLTPDRVEHLLRLGLSSAVQLKDGDCEAARRRLRRLKYTDLIDVATLMAACVDVDKTERELLAWYGGDLADLCPPARRTLAPVTGGRGTCSRCGKSRLLTAAGLVIRHSLQPMGAWCSGSRKPPVETAAEQTAMACLTPDDPALPQEATR